MAAEIEASDLFGLGGDFFPQTSNSPELKDPANFMDEFGNVECERMINERTEHTTPYMYCNEGSTDIKADLGLFLTKFGDVFNVKKVTQLVIGFEAGEFASTDLTGHQHASNPHVAGVAGGITDMSSVLPAGAGFGVPLLVGIVLGVDADFVSMSLTFSMTHVDVLGAAGEEFVGKNITPRAELTIEYTGIPSTPNPTGWTIDSQGPSDSNQAFDTFAISMHQHFKLTI